MFPFPGGWGAAGLCAPLQELPHGTSGLKNHNVLPHPGRGPSFLFFIFYIFKGAHRVESYKQGLGYRELKEPSCLKAPILELAHTHSKALWLNSGNYDTT